MKKGKTIKDARLKSFVMNKILQSVMTDGKPFNPNAFNIRTNRIEIISQSDTDINFRVQIGTPLKRWAYITIKKDEFAIQPIKVETPLDSNT